MAVYVNNRKIAGRGVDGASPFTVAVQNGFDGTEAEFNEGLKNINTIVADANAAAARAEAAQAAAENVKNNLSDYPTRVEMNNIILQNIATVDTGVWSYGPEAPSNTNLLWIDSNLINGGLKFYVNGTWIHVPVAWK